MEGESSILLSLITSRFTPPDTYVYNNMYVLKMPLNVLFIQFVSKKREFFLIGVETVNFICEMQIFELSKLIKISWNFSRASPLGIPPDNRRLRYYRGHEQPGGLHKVIGRLQLDCDIQQCHMWKVNTTESSGVNALYYNQHLKLNWTFTVTIQY